MIALLLGVQAQIGTLGRGAGGVLADGGDGLDRVPVLARVARQLISAQLACRPAAVEGMAKHVPALPGILDPAPSPLRHAILLLCRMPRRHDNTGVMRPNAEDIAVPPFPPDLAWIGPEPGAGRADLRPRAAARPLRGRRALSSVRTLPYLKAWGERYGDLGLTVIGVNSPRFPFTADPGQAPGRAGPARARPPGRGRLGLRGMARLRVQGMAVALPVGQGRRAPLGATSARASTRATETVIRDELAAPATFRSHCRRCGPPMPPARSSPCRARRCFPADRYRSRGSGPTASRRWSVGVRGGRGLGGHRWSRLARGVAGRSRRAGDRSAGSRRVSAGRAPASREPPSRGASLVRAERLLGRVRCGAAELISREPRARS